MSYIVLARKYRPQNFKEVYAQDHITEILQSAISTNRIAHAYLFTGPRGVGKTSLARILAKSLNCVSGPTTDPCNECSNCMEITSGTSPDVIEIDGASNTSVDDIRELQQELLYPASGSNYKIYIIDEVHMLSKSAFNALLKTLEEPPENVIFIFATTEPQKVLPTIISRCQRYDFKRIPIESIVQRMKEICSIEKIKIDNESLYLIAHKADGSMRDALSLMDQAISYCMDNITIDKVRQIFSVIPNQIYQRFITLIYQKNARDLINELQKIFEQGIDLQEFISGMQDFIRILLLSKLHVQIKDINPDEQAVFDEVAGLFGQNKLMYILSYLIASKTDLRSSSNPYLILEALMIKLCKIDEMEDIATLIS
ncbi:MAG: DNA polymerase III subunit gamma/tau, partial [Candidatus Cloacimonas sp.]